MTEHIPKTWGLHLFQKFWSSFEVVFGGFFLNTSYPLGLQNRGGGGVKATFGKFQKGIGFFPRNYFPMLEGYM